MPEQPILHMLGAQRLAQQHIAPQINLRRG